MRELFTRSYWKQAWNYLNEFDREKSFPEKFGLVTLMLFLNLIYVGVIIRVLTVILNNQIFKRFVFWGWMFAKNSVHGRLQRVIQQKLGRSIFFGVFLAPLWEEFVFRIFWLMKRLRAREKEKFNSPGFVKNYGQLSMWDLVLMSSVIFGLAHGGPINILIQGVSGLFLAYIYLINNRSSLSAMFLHAFYNAFIILGSYFWQDAVAGITMPYWFMWLQ